MSRVTSDEKKAKHNRRLGHVSASLGVLGLCLFVCLFLGFNYMWRDLKDSGDEDMRAAGKKIDEGSVVYCGVSAVGRGRRRGGGMPRPTPGLTDRHARRRCWWGSRGST